MKKFILYVICCMLLLTGCSNKVQEKGKVQQIGIEDAFSKMDKKETFLLMITRDECYYCQLIHKMLDDTIEDHPTTIYNVKMDDSTTENLYADNDLLKTRLEKPGTTPHVYYIKDGVVKDDITGFDEENPLEFWEWVKKHNIENLK